MFGTDTSKAHAHVGRAVNGTIIENTTEAEMETATINDDLYC